MLPLAPDLCVTTLMDFKLAVPNDFQLADLTTRPCGGVRPEAATLEQARFVNSLTVRHAGDIVLSSQAASRLKQTSSEQDKRDRTLTKTQENQRC